MQTTESEKMVATMELRWVDQTQKVSECLHYADHFDPNRGKKILQQLWINPFFHEKNEWRDVPIVSKEQE